MNKLYYLIFGVLLISSIYFLFNKKYKQPSPYITYSKLIPNTYRIGWTNLDKETSINELNIKGNIPKWLSGTLFRNGPAKFTNGSNWVSNWFDGLAMIHSFSFYEGAVSYANKFLRTDDYKFVKKTGKMSYWGFVQDPCSWFFKDLVSLFIPGKYNVSAPNANVNIAQFADKLVALTETPLPIEFDKTTLDTLGVLDYKDNLPKRDIHDTAHPQYDFESGEHIGYFTSFGINSTFNVYKIKSGYTERQVIYSCEVEKPSYMHSFFLTKNYAIFTFLPLVVNPLKLLFKKYGFIHNYKWTPELGTKFVVIDRKKNKLKGIYVAEPFFAFHTVNAYEEGNKIIMDIVNYADSSIIARADFVHLLAPHKTIRNRSDLSYLRRYTIDMQLETITSKLMCDISIELPRINYKKNNGKFYKYLYAYSEQDSVDFAPNKLVKIDITTGQKIFWSEPNCYVGEPVFIASPNARTEDDGVVLSVVLDTRSQTSFLLVLDAIKFKELGRALVPHHIPFGIHGIFMHK